MKTVTDFGSRRDRLMHEHIHDSYKTPLKLPEPTICPDCGAVFHDGHWQWTSGVQPGAHRTTCQACHRIRDDYPAGVVTMSGSFVLKHREELLNLARNEEADENQAHPLHRIMKIEEHPGSIAISTTDIHLPQRLADALQHAFHGELKVQYDQEGYFARVAWRREG